MADIFTKEKRSEVMSRVRGKGNKGTEIALIRLMRSSKLIGWRRNSLLFGRPDFVFPKRRVAIFIDGCFWHKCSKHGSLPTNNRDFWARKLNRNAVRDRLVTRTLTRLGWIVVRIWEHDLKTPQKILRRLNLAFARAELATRIQK